MFLFFGTTNVSSTGLSIGVSRQADLGRDKAGESSKMELLWIDCSPFVVCCGQTPLLKDSEVEMNLCLTSPSIRTYPPSRVMSCGIEEGPPEERMNLFSFLFRTG